ncbi:glycosyltransferase family 4 protein [Flavobacterium sp. W1B]|uniref:glycosyltransferase family 4 protein n=1 Tax=Flavobacterium sp. W1B TaxID=3394146 RepID=UPI0039BD1168
MNLVIITHVPHTIEQNQYHAYAPYINEMNVWAKQVKELIIVAPVNKGQYTVIDSPYHHKSIQFIAIDPFDKLSFKTIVPAILKTPKIGWKIYKAMQKAAHIHLRCPGNIGLIGCVVQILFPKKTKTAKYAGNWDPKSKQPWSYRLQKWILNNTFLTKNMQVLVYGQWEGSSVNVKSFFTATYKEEDKAPIRPKVLKDTINFVFVGALVKGKNPLYAIQLLADLSKKGFKVHLDLYGEGLESKVLERYILENQLTNFIILKGNQSQRTIKKAYQDSHFVILPSDSEGWPKALAEGMFWGCVPIATAVSCVPYMLDYGNRGILLEMNLAKDRAQMELILQNQADYNIKQKKASDWSRAYTLDVLEQEVKELLGLK